ncbi:ADP-ribosyltransferase-containing protein [Stenotrophomonas sp. FS3]
MIDNVLEGFDELSDEIETTRQVTLRSAYTGTSQKPEEAARANRLSDQLGQPFGVVAANLGDYEQDARRLEIDEAGRQSPHVGDFLADPRRMALASDEAPKLATYANSLVTGEARATAEPNILEQVIGGVVSGWQRGKANALALLPDGPAVMDPATGRLTTDRSAEEAALRADQERKAQAADVTSASTDRGFQAFDRANKAGSFGGAVRELASGGTDTLGAIAVTLGQSIGMGAPGLALTASTGGGSRVVTAASAGTGSGLTEFGASIADAMQDAKVDPTDAYAVGQFLRDPQKMAAAREKAAKRGVAIGVFDALTAGVAGHFINNARRSASSAVLRTGAEAGVQLAGGAAGEATAQLLTEERLKWGDIIMEGLAEVPTGAVEVHANYRAAKASGQVRWINERLGQVMDSGDANERLRAATELAADLKLGERSPEDMKALTAQVAGEDARVYLDAEQAQTLFQSAPQVLQDMVGGESALAEQLATGQVVIPMAEWMAAVPRLPNRDEILRNARTTAEGLSPAELETLDIDAMARELGVPLDAPAPDAAAASARAQVQQSVMAQLVGTDHYTPAQAESQAQLWGAMFGRLGEVTGQDPVALYERYAAGIEAAEAPAEGAEAQPRTLMQRGMDALRSLFGRPQVATDGRGQQTIEREGSAYVQRAGQWLLADDQGQARDFLTLDQARTEAERTGGEIVQDDPIEGQRQTWSVALPDTAAREVLAGDILFQSPSGQSQTETPAFRNWFGDSKVVDANGEPLVVYHGSDSSFDSFDSSALGKQTKAKSARSGFFFTDDPTLASDYTAAGGYSVEDGDLFGASFNEWASAKKGAQVYPVYLSITNPKVIEYGGQEYREIAFSDALMQAKADGHDGAIFRNARDPLYDSYDVPADIYVVFEPEQIKSATGNSGAFDGSNPSILFQGGAAPRGQIQIGPDRAMQISLFKGADLSTFLHESGHFFLEVYRDVATAEDAAPQLRSDLDALLKWFGVESADQIGVDQHEQFARGFEAYLGEGKAPTPELQSVFSQFKQWILGIYRSLQNLDVELTDEVRGVFDRMLASQEEIEAAQARVGFEPIARDLAEAQALGMTERQFADYQAQVAAAREQAEADLMAQLQEADARARERWWKDEVATIRSEVEAEVEATPIVRAYRVLTGRKEAGGEPVPEQLQGMKLDRAVLAATYGDGLLDKMGRVYARKGGTHPDEAAALLGFSSGDELVQGLWTVRQTLAGVGAEADARMQARHGEPMTDGTLPQRALDAVHGSRKIQLLERELGVLADLAREPRPNRRELKAVAEAVLSTKTARQIRPNEYLVAERKAARTAAQAATKGRYGEALQAKRQQALNAVLFAEARNAQEEFGKIERYLKQMTGDKARSKLGKAGADYLEQVDALLEGLEVKPVSGAQVRRRQSLAEWVDAQHAARKAINVPQRLLQEMRLTNISDMTIADLREIVGTVKQIAHLANTKNTLRLGKEERDAVKIDDAMAASVRAGNRQRNMTTGVSSVGDRAFGGFMQFRAIQGAATDIARELDGFVDGGPVWDNTIRVLRDAQAETDLKLREAQESLADLYRTHYSREELSRMARARPMELVNGDLWSHERLLALAMNWGNEGNRQAILTQVRGRLSAQQVGALLGQLDARDWAFVQRAWDMIDSYWPQISETERRRTGLSPEKVERSAFAVTTRDGSTIVVQGGYYPLKFQSDSVRTVREEAEDYFNAIGVGANLRAQTRDGHTIERVGSGGRTVKLELNVLDTHLRDVIRDLYLGDGVNYVHSVLNGQKFSEALADTGLLELRKALDYWLQDAAAGEMAPRMWAEQAARFFRSNFTAAVLTWRVSSAMLQLTGVSQSTVILGAKPMWQALQNMLRHPRKSYQYVDEASTKMRLRAQTHADAVQEVMDAKAGRIAAGRAAAIRWGYAMMGQVQRIVDVQTWLAAEQVGLEKFGGDTAKARAYADDVVTRAQGSQDFVDKTPLQRGTLNDSTRQSEWVKSTTMLAGYMLAKGNLIYERTRTTNFRSPRQALKWGTHMFMLLVLENLITAALRGKLPNDEDDDGIADDLAVWILKEGAFGMLGTIPGLNQLSANLRGYDGGGAVATLFSTIYDAYEQAGQGELDRAAVRVGVDLTGQATGIPSTQINKTIDLIQAERDGRDVSALNWAMQEPPKKE